MSEFEQLRKESAELRARIEELETRGSGTMREGGEPVKPDARLPNVLHRPALNGMYYGGSSEDC